MKRTFSSSKKALCVGDCVGSDSLELRERAVECNRFLEGDCRAILGSAGRRGSDWEWERAADADCEAVEEPNSDSHKSDEWDEMGGTNYRNG